MNVARRETGRSDNRLKRRFRQIKLPRPDAAQNEGSRLSEWLSTWIDDRIEPSHATGTVQRYRSIVRRVARELGDPRLSDVTQARVAELYRKLMAFDERGRRITSNTLISYHAVLRQGFAYAVELGLIENNPVIPPPKPGRRITPIALSPAQIELLLANCSDLETQVMVGLIVRTGLRRGECLALRWKDIDLVAQTLHVSRSLQRFSVKGYVIVEPKTRQASRSIALSPAMSSLLSDYRATQEARAGADGTEMREDWLVFGKRDDQPRSWYFYWGRFDQARRAAGFPTLRIHDLRHTAASLMMLAGVHPKVMSARLGHSSIQVTLDAYSHVLPQMEADAASAVEEVLGGDSRNGRSSASA